MKMMLSDLIAERDHFIGDNPKLQAYQAEIDRVLDGCADGPARMSALSLMASCKMVEMANALGKLRALLSLKK
jgi:hypothetical protein